MKYVFLAVVCIFIVDAVAPAFAQQKTKTCTRSCWGNGFARTCTTTCQ